MKNESVNLEQVLAEHDAWVALLRAHGIDVVVFEYLDEVRAKSCAPCALTSGGQRTPDAGDEIPRLEGALTTPQCSPTTGERVLPSRLVG